MTAPKVAIACPYYKTVDGQMMMSILGLGIASAAHVAMLPIRSKGCYIEENRNGAVEYALNTGLPFDFMLWIDSDMIFPEDSLLRLIKHNKDIVGANYRQREAPYSYTGYYLDGTDVHLMEPGLHPMRHLPAGLMLVKFDIYRKLLPPWYRSPRMKGEPRDEVYFCNLAREAGYEIWCDHDLTNQVRHIGDQEIPWFNQDQIKTVYGAAINQARAEQEARDRASIVRDVNKVA